MAVLVDRWGRRNIACGGLTTMLGAVTCIGILGVAPDSSASDSLLVFFACVFSECPQFSSIASHWSSRDASDDHSRRSSVFRIDWMGICRRDFVSATATLYRRIRRRHFLCWWRHHERLGSLHAERKSMGESSSMMENSRANCCQNWGLKTAFFYTGLGAPFAIAAWFIIPEPAG